MPVRVDPTRFALIPVFDDGGVQERVQLIRPATRERMARAELDASNWRRTDERHWRMLWDHEAGKLPSHRESRFWLTDCLRSLLHDRFSRLTLPVHESFRRISFSIEALPHRAAGAVSRPVIAPLQWSRFAARPKGDALPN